jgi:drug/metabolite transporter (DMT)-like permease
MSSQTKGVFIALIATTAWATTAIFIRYLLTHFALAPLTLAFWRDFILATTLLVVFRLWKPEILRIRRQDLPFLAAYGGVVLATFNASWTFSIKLNGAAVATVLSYCSPAFTLALAWLLVKEPLTWRKGLAAALSLVGCVGVAKAYAPEIWQLNPLGLLIGLVSGFAFAVYSLAGRWSAKRFASPWTVMTYGFLFAAGALAFTQTPQTIFSLGTAWDGWLILATLAIGPTLIGYGLYTVSLRYLSASVATVIASLEPVLTAILAIFLLLERLDWPQWLGGGLILGAVILTQGEAPGSPPVVE